MKIYTKTGDQGLTSLIGGTKVRKDNPRVNAYGTVDELNSWVGLLRDVSANTEEINLLIYIQDRLFIMGSHLASDPEKSKMKLPDLSLDDVLMLEKSIDKMDEKLPVLKNFILPGGHQHVSYCQIARSVCRRAEREIMGLDLINNEIPLLIYLNRLSDFLFTLARFWSMNLVVKEIPWIPGRIYNII